MSSRKFCLILLSTTVFGFLPSVAMADITLDSSAITTAQTSSNNLFNVTDNVTITSGTKLQTGELDIDGTSSPDSVIKGSLLIEGSDTVPTLKVNKVGNFAYDSNGIQDWETWTSENTHGWTNLSGDSATEAAINAKNANLDLTGSVFANSNNSSSNTYHGGVILVNSGSTLTSKGNIYFNNQAATNGGAIVLNSDKANSFTSDWFVKNKANKAGAIDVYQNIDQINSVFFAGNEATTNGGALFVESTGKVGSITDSNFIKNVAGNGDGGAIYVGGTVGSIEDSTFSGNKATNGGALFIAENGGATIKNSQFLNNTATKSAVDNTGAGGAIVAYTHSNLTTSGNTFSGNSLAGEKSVAGGAVHNDNGIWNSTNDTFTGNISSSDGGAIGSNGTTVLTNANITDNTATLRGGGIVARNSADLADLTINNSTISGNTAATGGGIANVNLGEEYSNRSKVTINGSRIERNTAAIGAGIFNDQDMLIDGQTTISGNTGTSGGGIYNAGKGVLTLKGDNVTISGNTATLGQNLYNEAGGQVNIDSVNDQVDLDYVPYTDTPKPQENLHTLFDQNQDIYNAGTINITNSKLQLHQGINTNATLTDDTQRKVGTVNITGSTVDLGGSDVPGAGVMYGDQVNINANSTIKTHISTENDGLHGRISAHDINVSNDNTNLNVTVGVGELQQGESREYQILQGDKVTGEFAALGNNKSYDMEALGNGNYKIYRKANYCPGCDVNENNTNNGWLDQKIDPSQNSDAADIQNQLNEASQYGNPHQREALDGLAPDVSPLVQAHATEITQRLASIVNDRFYESMERTGYVHRGKRFYRFPRHDSNLWVQGLYGKSKYDVRKGWDMDNRGISVGLDGHVSDAVRLGIAYAYTKSSGESVQRDTDIKSHTGMIYGNYNPNRFYANWLAMYTRSKYDEDKKVFNHNVKANYNVDAAGAQLMLGRKMGPYVGGDWATGVIKPEIGARYVYTKQHSYTDSVGQNVGSADGHTLTGILGAQYTIGYTLSPTLSWYPELRAALTYDFVEPDTKMRVNLLNGSVYEVKTENMDRFGIEVGARIGLDINRKAEIALEYEGLFKGDYTNHTGLANLKYKF